MDSEDIPELHDRAAEAMQHGDREEAERLTRQLIAAIEEQGQAGKECDLLALSYYNLGTILTEQGRARESVPCYRRTLSLLAALPRAEATPERRNLMAQASFNLGNSCLDADDPAGALAMF